MRKNLKVFVGLVMVLLIFLIMGLGRQMTFGLDPSQSSLDTLSQLKQKLSKTYHPTDDVKMIAQKMALTQKGLDIFYISQPKILDAKSFSEQAPKNFDSRATLGYYKNRKIYIYNIQNPDLAGIVEVTSAHETLHAVWQRMSQAKKNKVGQLLEADYQRVKTPKLASLMSDYEKSEPGQRTNELFAILGTEYGNLSSALEAQYAKIFKDRHKIVAMAASYQAKFDELSLKSNQLSQEITNLKTELDTELARYQSDIDQLNAEVSAFNGNAENAHYADDNEFDLKRQQLLQRVSELESRQTALNDKVNLFNEKVAALNQISIRASEYNKSIDARASLSGPTDTSS